MIGRIDLFKVSLLVLVIAFSGCTRYILGTYVRQPKEGEEGNYGRVFVCSYPECYQMSQEVLKDMGVLIFYKNEKEHYISAMYFDRIYNKCIDTTEVGIFFKEIDENATQINVACGNYGLAEFAADRIFSGLDEKLIK